MAEQEPKSMFDWLKENSWNLIVTLMIVAAGYGAARSELNYIKEQTTENKVNIVKGDERVVVHEKVITELRQVQIQTVNRLDRVESDSRTTQHDVSDIKAQIGVLSTKLDNVIDLLKSEKSQK